MIRNAVASPPTSEYVSLAPASGSVPASRPTNAPAGWFSATPAFASETFVGAWLTTNTAL